MAIVEQVEELEKEEEEEEKMVMQRMLSMMMWDHYRFPILPETMTIPTIDLLDMHLKILVTCCMRD